MAKTAKNLNEERKTQQTRKKWGETPQTKPTKC